MQPEWTPDQIERRNRVIAGATVVATLRGGRDAALIAWAMDTGRYTRIDRQTPYGNPYVIGTDGDRAAVIARYREDVRANPEIVERLGDLRGRVLGCWCYPLACHGDVIAEIANSREAAQ